MASDLALSLPEATESIHLRRRGGSYLEVTAIIDWVVRQSIFGEERGIIGLETALVLIAFVVVSSVFAFASLSTDLFANEIRARSGYIVFKAGTPSSLVVLSNHSKTSVCRGMPFARRSCSSSCSARPGYSTLS